MGQLQRNYPLTPQASAPSQRLPQCPNTSAQTPGRVAVFIADGILQSIGDPSSLRFAENINRYFTSGLRLIQTLRHWNQHGTKHKGTIQILDLPDKPGYRSITDELRLTGDYWCARSSIHTLASSSSSTLKSNGGLYDMFKQGLLEKHSEHEQEYIESCQSATLLHSYSPNEAEVWRMAYNTPAPSTNRTFVILFLCREMPQDEQGRRSFMNVTVPFDHPSCVEKQDTEKSRVRGKYVSVEYVQELDDGRVQWSMATSSDAGGSIPQFITNASLPGAIAEDVPSFLAWVEKRNSIAAGSISTALPHLPRDR